MTDSEAREMVRDLVRGSIIEDAAAQFIAQILKHAHDERIKPLQARLTAAEAEVEKLRGALQIARVHVANNAEGWSVSRGAARDDLTIVDAALTTEERK